MADKEKKEEVDETPQKPSLVKTLISSALSTVLLGGVAAGVVFMVPSGGSTCSAEAISAPSKKDKAEKYEEIAFVNLETLVVSLGPSANSEYLKISISIETTKSESKGIEILEPKFRDLLNTYLRAVDERDLIEPAAMTRLRAQMLRRMQLVAPQGAIKNVLITDFILN